jgi:hypothetical protein
VLGKVTPHVIDAGQSGTVLSGASIRGYVDVSLGEVPNPLTAEGFGRDTEAKRRQNSADYQPLQDGLTDLAGNRAYYAYYTETYKDINYYSLRVYLVIPVQRAAPSAGTTYQVFWLEGGTRNTPQSVRGNVPLIQRIIWSFRPT